MTTDQTMSMKLINLQPIVKHYFPVLSVKKTKEMIIDIRKSKTLPHPIIINDHTVERVRLNVE